MLYTILLENAHVMLFFYIMGFRFVLPSLLQNSLIIYFAGYSIAQLPISIMLDIANPFKVSMVANWLILITMNLIVLVKAATFYSTTHTECLLIIMKVLIFVHGFICSIGFLGSFRVSKILNQVAESKILIMQTGVTILFIFSSLKYISLTSLFMILQPIGITSMLMMYFNYIKHSHINNNANFISLYKEMNTDLSQFIKDQGYLDLFYRILFLLILGIVCIFSSSPIFWYLISNCMNDYVLDNSLLGAIILTCYSISFFIGKQFYNYCIHDRLLVLSILQSINIIAMIYMACAKISSIYVICLFTTLIGSIGNAIPVILIRVFRSMSVKYATLMSAFNNMSTVGSGLVCGSLYLFLCKHFAYSINGYYSFTIMVYMGLISLFTFICMYIYYRFCSNSYINNVN